MQIKMRGNKVKAEGYGLSFELELRPSDGATVARWGGDRFRRTFSDDFRDGAGHARPQLPVPESALIQGF